MQITEYKPEDRKQIEHCISELQNYEIPLEPDRVPGEQMAKQYLQHLLDECSKNSGKLFVADVDGKIAGFVCAWQDQIGEDYVRVRNDYLYISDYIVLENFRNQGIGKALIKRAEHYAKELGLKIVQVGVLAKNTLARDVYKSLGFEEYDLTLTKNL